MQNFVQPAIAAGLAYATGGLSTAVGIAFTASAAISTVGAITGDKDLMKVGALVGIGAGVASLAGVGTGALAGEGAATAGAEQAALDATSTGPNLDGSVLEGYQNAVNPAGGAVTGTVAVPGAPAVTPAVANAPSVAAKAAGVVPTGVPTAAPGEGGILSFFNKQPDLVKYGALQVGGNALAGAFGPDQEKMAADKLALEKERLAQEQANLDWKRANFNNVGLINMRMSPNYSASLYPNKTGAYPYRTPVITKP